jgi:hypothetical protein
VVLQRRVVGALAGSLVLAAQLPLGTLLLVVASWVVATHPARRLVMKQSGA